MDKVAILAITRNGIEVGRRIRDSFEGWTLHAPEKFRGAGGGAQAAWFSEPSTEKVGELFRTCDGLVCLFSLGAVIRLVSPHLRDKKSDPAVIVIDDRANFVISVLSGHLGGANRLAGEIASKLPGSTPVITTAADVNNTIAVDLVGREFGWVIDDDSTVTATSAHMVNGEKIGVYQDAGERDWWRGRGQLPGNVHVFEDLDKMRRSDSRAFLIISDTEVGGDTDDGAFLSRSVVYRPKSLIVGVGLHRDTTKGTIVEGIRSTFAGHGLSTKSIAGLASIRKEPGRAASGALAELAGEMGVPVHYVDREKLASVEAPNPSYTVRAFEGTSSVSEAAAILVSGGDLVVEKQKFPPDLTIAVARRPAP